MTWRTVATLALHRRRLQAVAKAWRGLLTGVLLLCGMGWSFGTWAQGNAATLQVGVLPNVSARVLLTQYESVQAYLSQRLGLAVAVSTAPDWREFYQRVRRGDYAVVIAAANVARLMERDLGYHPILAFEPRIPAILVAAKGTDAALPALLNGKAVVIANPASLVAFEGQDWLAQRGLEAGRNYQTLRVRGDDSVGSAILRGDAQAGILSMGEFRAHREAIREQLTVLATMAEVAGFIVCVSKELPTAQVEALRAGLLAFGQGTDEGRQFFQRTGFRAITPVSERTLAAMDPFVDRTRKALE